MALSRAKEIVNIPVELVRPNTYQPRKNFNRESLEELTESIRKYGVLQPINVRTNGSRFYELIAGERRLRASEMAGLKEIPAIVVDATDEDSAVLALIENLQREDLSYIEEAEGYESLIKDHNYTQEQLAEIIGKKQSTIANKLRILRLSDRVKDKLLEYNLTERHARALLKIPDEELQLKLIEKINKYGYNVKKTEELVENEVEKIENLDDRERDRSSRRVKKAIMNARIYINTIKNVMEKNGVNAQYSYEDMDEFIEVMVKIPKSL